MIFLSSKDRCLFEFDTYISYATDSYKSKYNKQATGKMECALYSSKGVKKEIEWPRQYKGLLLRRGSQYLSANIYGEKH